MNYIIKVHVTPNAKENSIKYDEYSAVYRIHVKQKAYKNKANVELVNYLASMLNVLPENIVIIKGLKSREKVLLVKNANAFVGNKLK